MLKKFLIAFAILIPIIIGLLFLLPSEVKIRGSVEVHAPASKIYPYVANLKNWSLWAPWKDQRKGAYKIEFTYSGPEQGEGAVMHWKDPKQRGGSIEITKAEPNKSIEYILTADNGAKAYGALILTPGKEGKTRVTWLDQLNVGNNLFARFQFWAFASKSIQTQLKASLGTLKNLVEKNQKKASPKKENQRKTPTKKEPQKAAKKG
ncbi:MAG TPA: hypothetical protein ENK02_04870 [Planctomycetes bacterium]|nr:hypothetical protein [Planctomycetota bacterium]